MVKEYMSYGGRHAKEYIHQKERETRFKPWNHPHLMGRYRRGLIMEMKKNSD